MRLPDLFDRWMRRSAEAVVVPTQRYVSEREKVHAHPQAYTRATRRLFGYRKPAWAEFMRLTRVASTIGPLPRTARRHMAVMYAEGPQPRRVRKQRARIRRAFARQGMEVA